MSYSMDRANKLLEGICEDLERQIRPKLKGAIGDLVHDYLPQAWVFETEFGECTLHLDAKGNARVIPGISRKADVTIRWRRDALVSALASGNRDSVPAGDHPKVIVHTNKGRVAFNYLKKEIGL